MHYRLIFAMLVVALAIFVKALPAADTDTAYPEKLWLQKDDATPAPESALKTAIFAEDAQLVSATPVSTVTYQFRMRTQPSPPSTQYYDSYGYGYGYIPGDYSREGFYIEPGSWWIGNQPYLPYYGYNPPTIDGYYPPYAYNSGYGRGRGSSYGYGSGIVPAPPLASPPAYVPSLMMPVAPAPTRISRDRNGGYIIERHPNFHLFYVPQMPNFVTSGSAVYQMPPNSYFYYGYPNYPY